MDELTKKEKWKTRRAHHI